MQGSGGQLSIALYFTGNDFRSHMRLLHRLVRLHGLAHRLRYQVVHIGCGRLAHFHSR